MEEGLRARIGLITYTIKVIQIYENKVEKVNFEEIKEWVEAGGYINKRIQEEGLVGITLLELNCGLRKNTANEEDERLKIASYLI